MVEIFKKNKLLILFLVLIFCFSLFSLVFFTFEPDYFWHIKAGEVMSKTSKILTHDVFSWYMTGKYWFSHEWLFEVLIYSLSTVFSKYHVYIYCFITFFILQLTIFLSNKDEYLKNVPFSMLWISLSAILFYSFQARPHMISFCLLSFTILILYDIYNNEQPRKYLFLPLISLCWVNFHGGSSNLVYLLPILFLLAGLFSFNTSKISAKKYTKLQIKKYILCVVLGFIPLFLNPHGYKMILYPYQNMGNSVMLSNIMEWHCSDLNALNHYPYFLVAFLTFCFMFFSKKKIRFLDFLLFLFTLYLGLKSIRFWPFIYIVMSYCIWYYIPKRKLDKGTDAVLIILSVIFVGLLLMFKPGTESYRKVNEKAIMVLKKEQPQRLFNYYDYGGYLIYNDIKVFIDGRADLYSGYNFEDWLDIMDLDYNYTKLLKKYNFDYFIIPKKCGLATYLKTNSYDLIYSDSDVVIYKTI